MPGPKNVGNATSRANMTTISTVNQYRTAPIRQRTVGLKESEVSLLQVSRLLLGCSHIFPHDLCRIRPMMVKETV